MYNKYYMTNFIVSFVGIQSLEKIYVIESLVFKKLLNPEIYKSTLEFKLIEEYIIDDKNNKFNVYNIPDSYNIYNYTTFNNLKYSYISKSNLIIWISNIHNAFQTIEEINEFNKLKKYIKDIEESTGKIYYIIIMLSKYEYITNLENSNELININDLILKVKNKFPEEDIILYNVYEKPNNIMYYIFKKFIKKIGILKEYNTLFDISKYILDFTNKQQISYYNKFLFIYDKFLNNEPYDIILFWKNITLKEQVEHITKIIKYRNYNNNYRVFQYINLVSNMINFNKNNHIVNHHMYKYYIDILKNNKFSYLENYYKNYSQDEVIYLFVDNFINLPFNIQLSLYKSIIFNNNIEDIIIIKILNCIHSKGYTKEQFNFIQIFNNFIKINNNNNNKYYHFYTRIKGTINNNYIIEIPYALSLLEQFNYYIDKLNLLSENTDYILLNKLEIINILRMDSNIKNFDKYRHLIIFNTHAKQFYYNNRLNNNITYLTVINKIWTKIYSNVEISYNHYNSDFIPFDKTELLY